jgi:hypothetical protein
MTKQKAKILIATPMYGGMCSGHYTESMLSVPPIMNNEGILIEYCFMLNNSLITAARNALANAFMKGDFTHLMFIDADIKFNARDIVSMLERDVPIIGGVYPSKHINWERVANGVKNNVPFHELKKHSGHLVVHLAEKNVEKVVKANEVVEVLGTGTGFMLIKREAFETIKPHVKTYRDPDSDGIEFLYEYFYLLTSPNTGYQLSEDFSFCHVCREHGVKSYIAPWVKLEHLGSYLFEGGLIPVKTEETNDLPKM